jgi:ABC-type transport system involved in cytochrome c biogenesis permease subunit
LTLQLALAAGALLGRFTRSERFAGRLPPLWRGLAVVQAGPLAAMACAVLDRGSAINLGLAPTAFWLALATTGLTLLANAVSQSRRERLLWTPITLAMTSTAVYVARLRRQTTRGSSFGILPDCLFGAGYCRSVGAGITSARSSTTTAVTSSRGSFARR